MNLILKDLPDDVIFLIKQYSAPTVPFKNELLKKKIKVYTHLGTWGLVVNHFDNWRQLAHERLYSQIFLRHITMREHYRKEKNIHTTQTKHCQPIPFGL